MKHFFLVNIIAILFLLIFSPLPTNVSAEPSLELNSPYYVLIEPKSKKVICESNSKEKLYPASMTKMMGMLLVLESIEKGKIHFEDEVVCSEYASSMGGTQIFLEPQEKMKLEDLFKAVAINSANDAIVCLGEYLEGSNDAFVSKMNKRAQELGMKNTSFKNATGFDDKEHYTCPYDMGLVACELLKYEDVVLKYSSLKEAYIRENSSSPFWLVNTNKLLGHYEGLDGLKTGFTNDAGYNLCATAKRNGVRLISVVMKEETIKKRSQDTCKLLDYGFSLLKSEIVFNAEQIISSCQIRNSLTKEIGIKVKQDIKVIMNKDEKIDDLKIEVEIPLIEAPIKEDDIIGTLKITTPSLRTYTFDVFASEEVEKISYGKVFLNNLKIIFS